MSKNISSERGVTLFIAVLVCSMVSLAVLSITSIASKQLVISGSIKSSQKAYIAADSGMECAQYWDAHNYENPDENLFNISSPDVTGVYCKDTTSIASFGQFGTPVDCTGSGGSSFKTSFNVDYDNGTCAKITIIKTCDISGSKIKTTIDSLGYNTSCGSVGGSNRVVERAIESAY